MVKNFTAHRLRFVAEAVTPIALDGHAGTSLRAAFFNALTDGFCMNRPALRNGGCASCPLVQTCPVAFLAATLDPQADRGENVPRPFAIEPATNRHRRRMTNVGRWSLVVGRSSSFEFGLTMFARALNLFPYVVLSVERMERNGIGRKVEENGWRRGTFRVREIVAENPITGERQEVLRAGDRLVTVPDVPVTQAQVGALPAPGPGARVRVVFRTPTRLKERGEVVREPEFRVLFQRLMERLAALAQEYSDSPLDREEKYRLVGLAGRVRTVEAATEWVKLESFSSRIGGHTSISGIAGHVVYEADDWAPFWPWLKWGELTHVGKNAVKGEGVIEVREA